MSQGGNRARIHTYRTPKKVFLANQAQGPSPAWKGDRGGSGAPPTHRESGSRILISRLPPDVTLQELSDLFNRTIGPTKEVMLFYNDKGLPKGMAMVDFQRDGDAAVAADRYDGRCVDNRRFLEVEIVVGKDGYTPSGKTLTKESPSHSPQSMTLLERMNIAPAKGPFQPKAPKERPQKAPAAPAEVITKPKAVPTKRKRTRKGPARLTKNKVTVQDLDAEMDAYRAAVPQIGGGTNKTIIA